MIYIKIKLHVVSLICYTLPNISWFMCSCVHAIIKNIKYRRNKITLVESNTKNVSILKIKWRKSSNENQIAKSYIFEIQQVLGTQKACNFGIRINVTSKYVNNSM